MTTSEFIKSMRENFAKGLKQANLGSKKWYCWFCKKIDFEEKLRRINDKVTSNKTKYVETEKKLNDHIALYAKLRNDL